MAMVMLIIGQAIIIETGYVTTVSVWISLVGGFIYDLFIVKGESRMIEIVKISQSYGDFKVLNEIPLQIHEGKITALIGANGAGKSTLLGVISRLLTPSYGQVFIDGEDIALMKSLDVAKKLAILKQTNQHQVRISIRDLVSFGRFPHSKGRLKDEDINKINQAIHYMNLSDIEHKIFRSTSGGQRQRAIYAMILAQDTKYVFLDEPLNNLDMKYAVEMMTILQKMVKELNKTVIVVMHD
jgi:iron complex transport system ATP-binding protein